MQVQQQQADDKAAQLQTETQQLRARLQGVNLDRARERAQLDAFHSNQIAAAAEGQMRVRE